MCLVKSHRLGDAIRRLPGYALRFDAPFFREFVVRCPRPARDIIAAAKSRGRARGPRSARVRDLFPGLRRARPPGRGHRETQRRRNRRLRRAARPPGRSLMPHRCRRPTAGADRSRRPRRRLFEKSQPGRRGYPSAGVGGRATPSPRISCRRTWCAARRSACRRSASWHLVRHFIELSIKNHHIDKAMYPLGSCTMKYNPKVNEEAARIEGFRGMHPLQDVDDTQGALEVLWQLQTALQRDHRHGGFLPHAGRRRARRIPGDEDDPPALRRAAAIRSATCVLIPDSAHGTNPASVRMAGMHTRAIDLGSRRPHRRRRPARRARRPRRGDHDHQSDHRRACSRNASSRSRSSCTTAGAFVYMDGANMNALVGVTRPGDMGFDVMHLNLHKTFSTPHGGGGPGAGPIGVRGVLRRLPAGAALASAMPDGRLHLDAAPDGAVGPIHSYCGNFGILLRALTYIKTQRLRRPASHRRERGPERQLPARQAARRLRRQVRPRLHARGGAARLRLPQARRQDARRREAPHGLRLPSADDLFPADRRGCAHDRADRVRNPRDPRRIRRRDAGDPPRGGRESRSGPCRRRTRRPVRRLDEGLAARQLDLVWRQGPAAAAAEPARPR